MARVLVFADHFVPGHRAGGPIRSVARIVESEASEHDVCVVTRDHDMGSRERFEIASPSWVPMLGVRVLYVDTRTVGGLVRGLRQVRSVEPDLVYLNSLFSPMFTLAPLMGRRRLGLRCPVLLAPRGECGPEALAIKGGKKRVVSRCLRTVLKRVDLVWHSTSDRETADTARWLGRSPDRVVTRSDPGTRPALEPSAVLTEGRLQIVGVSRIAPVKDVARFLRIIGGLSVEVEARYYGPMEDVKYWESCRPLIDALPPNVNFRYEGELSPDSVASVFGGADAFLFPTKGENFGHVIAESLSVGCVVVTTPTTMWTDLLEQGAGAVFHHDGEAVAWLEALAGQSPTQRALGRRRAWELYSAWRDSVGNEYSLFSAALRGSVRWQAPGS